METKYIARASTTGRIRVGIHAAGCSVVAGTSRKYVCFPVEGATAAEAAANVARDEQLAERGLPMPHVCDCAK